MKVLQSRLTALFMACGAPTADRWDADKLRGKVAGGMGRFREPDAVLEDAKLNALFDDIVAAQTRGEEIEVEADGVPAEPPPKSKTKPKSAKSAAGPKSKPAKKVGAKKATKATASDKTKSAGGKKTGTGVRGGWNPESGKPREFSDRGPGITKYLVSILVAAGEGAKDENGVPRGVTKAKLLEKVSGRYKDRDPDKLETTINNQVPTRLRQVRHIYVQRNQTTRGYYIEGDGRKQPSSAKAARKSGKA